MLKDQTFQFAVRIVNATKVLRQRNCDYVLIRQILRSGTSIGANVAEAQVAFSKAEFAAKLSIALKEGKKTEYWLLLLQATSYLQEAETKSLLHDLASINRMLYSSIHTAKHK